MATAGHKWQFRPRFRRHAFGWRSDTPIQRIKEALTEIKQVARRDPILAADGAVSFLEKVSPALEQVDSSSGALGSAVNKAIETLVPIIGKAEVDSNARQRWLQRLWQALQDDDMPYIELLGEYWGELCVTPELASYWVDEFLPVVERIWSPMASGHDYFKGTSACLASLYAAGRNEQLLSLINKVPFKWWHYRRWGVKALVAMGKKMEAISYAEDSRGLNDPGWQIARACEAVLLSSGMAEEAYRRYAIEANQGATNLATFRAIAKKYPGMSSEQILRDLIKCSPGVEGKWFASAKDAGLFDLAIELVKYSPTDPKTLTRASRDFSDKQPIFALEAALAALRWIAAGHGYEITGLDVLDALDALTKAATNTGLNATQVKALLNPLLENHLPNGDFIRKVIAHRL